MNWSTKNSHNLEKGGKFFFELFRCKIIRQKDGRAVLKKKYIHQLMIAHHLYFCY